MNQLVPIRNRFDGYETSAYNFTAAQENHGAIAFRDSGSSSVKPLRPERSFFTDRPEPNSRSIPVKVAVGMSAKPDCRAGVGRHVRVRPPHVTRPCEGLMRKDSVEFTTGCSEDSTEPLTFENLSPFFEEKEVASLDGRVQRGNKVAKTVRDKQARIMAVKEKEVGHCLRI